MINWYWIVKLKKVPNYTLSTIVRGWAFIAVGIIHDVQEKHLVPFTLFALCSFWVFFDILLNVTRGKSIFYTGKNSTIDKFSHNHPEMYWMFKVVALIYFIIYLTYMI